MLSKKQAVYRIVKSKISPFKLATNQQNLNLIQQMIELTENSVGERITEIEESLHYLARQIWQPKIIQAIVKLLLDKGDYNKDEEQQAADLREKVFNESAIFWSSFSKKPKLETIPKIILQNINVSENNKKWKLDNDNWIYNDLKMNQKLIKFNSILAKDFIDWFNLCMVKAVLLQAKKIDLNFFSYQENLRKFMQSIRFFGLLFDVKKESDNFIITINGPESILESSRSYGIHFSNLFSALLLLKDSWKLESEIYLANRKQTYQLSIKPTDGYKNFYQPKNSLRKDTIKNFISKWNKENFTQKAELVLQIFQLKNNHYLLPDFAIKSKTNKYFYFEWLNYYASQQELIKQKASAADKNYCFLIIGSKKKIMPCFEKLFIKKQLLCFTKDFTISKIKDFLEKKKFK